jgi:hypothetical protein
MGLRARAVVPGHTFDRDNTAKGNPRLCAMCRNLWDDGGSALFPYYRCGKCGLLVHAACRSFAQKAHG